MSDSLVALVVVVMHGTIIMCQGMAYSVAMNSKRSSALVALLIATNFLEIKGEGADLVDTKNHVPSFVEIKVRLST